MNFPAPHRRFLSVSVTILILLGALAGLARAAARAPEEHPAQVTYDARTMDADVKTHVMHLTDVTITYGKMTVKADRAFATAGDFKNSRWTFDGNVRINAEPRGNLKSDEAVVEFEDNQLKRATATGNPAEFDQKREDSDQVTRGHAKEIVYEVGAGTVRLSNDAWVADDKGVMTAPEITYDLRQERVEASTSGSSGTTGGPVHVTIPASETPRLETRPDNKPDANNKPNPPTGDGGASDPAPSNSKAGAPAAAPAPTTSGTTPAAPPPAPH
jgi:lipopolysaccharide transport protein LptA